MHTTEIKGLDNTWWVFHHNGDYSGDVIFEHYSEDYGKQMEVPLLRFEVPFEILEELVGQKINSDLMSILEDLDGKGTLKFLTV